MVNVTSVVDLTHAFLPAMVERQEGAIINVSSLAAFQSFPYMAIYPASKAFVLSLSEALTAEYEEHGVRVMALCPGEVRTNFAKVSGAPVPPGPKMVPEQVVEAALKGLEHGRSSVTPGVYNRLMRTIWSLIPRRAFAHAMATSLKPRHQNSPVPLPEKEDTLMKP